MLSKVPFKNAIDKPYYFACKQEKTMAKSIEFTSAELLEIEHALEEKESGSQFHAAVYSAYFKVGLALERPWALQKQRERLSDHSLPAD
ncbi:hypothetical protein [Pseudomonas sp. VB3]|uniref:hypothetical protein n=1 Tax=Pseudomonas sp. VB3 TaxID=2994641 RepID=UPI0022EC2A40|nr:hypothetical protein [Pseudomonas sp. VB3]